MALQQARRGLEQEEQRQTPGLSHIERVLQGPPGRGRPGSVCRAIASSKMAPMS